MILLIDNYDSFSYNLYQLIGSIEPDIMVIRNDAMTVDEIDGLDPAGIVISPGPGRPEDAGVCVELVKKLGSKYPILGVCLGHQAICLAHGAKITYAKELMHGKQSIAKVLEDDPILKDIPNEFLVARYHSLVADKETIPSCLRITSVADDDEVMSVKHESYDIYGLQFHPESIMTPDGKKLIDNFIKITKRHGGALQ